MPNKWVSFWSHHIRHLCCMNRHIVKANLRVMVKSPTATKKKCLLQIEWMLDCGGQKIYWSFKVDRHPETVIANSAGGWPTCNEHPKNHKKKQPNNIYFPYYFSQTATKKSLFRAQADPLVVFLIARNLDAPFCWLLSLFLTR